MSRTFLQMILIYFFEFLGDSCMTGVLSTSLFKTFLLHLEIRYLARYFLGFLSYCLNKGFFCKSQILGTLHFKYYNNNHYTFPYNQLVPDSTLYSLRRYYRWCWYILEFLGDRLTTGILPTSVLRIFLYLLEIWYLAWYFLGPLTLFFE